MEEFESDARPRLDRSRVAIELLNIGGWIVAIVSLIWGISEVAAISPEENWVRPFFGATFRAGIGIGLAMLLWGVMELIRGSAATREAIAEISAAAAPAADRHTRPVPRPAPDDDTMNEVAVLLREVRDISLLNEGQRQMRLEAQGRVVAEMLERDVPSLLKEHNWIEARNRIQSARERFPGVSNWDALEQQIERMRAQVEQHDVEAAERQVADLVSLGAWDRVNDVLEELVERHPDSIRARQIAESIRAKRNAAEAELRSQLLMQAQKATNERDWSTAMSIAQQLIQRFPKSPEAQALRMQLPTLRANVEIKVRQRMEADFRDRLRAGQYDEALRIANEVIDHYPSSPQANALREQLPKLVDKVRVPLR